MIVNPPPILIFAAAYTGLPDVTTPVNESYPFVVSKEITVKKKATDLIDAGGHFWSVVNIGSRIFFGELNHLQKGLEYRQPAPFVMQYQEDGERVQSCFHIYRDLVNY
jgi:hypothetical protein